jgi:Ca2+-transporting ATPase
MDLMRSPANIIADVPPAMSLGLEPPEVDIMERRPRDPDQGVLTKMTSMVILAQGLGMTVLTFSVFIISNQHYNDLSMARSIAFALLTCLQLVQAFYARSLMQSVFVTGILSNIYMVLATLFSFAMLIMGIYVPGKYQGICRGLTKSLRGSHAQLPQDYTD